MIDDTHCTEYLHKQFNYYHLAFSKNWCNVVYKERASGVYRKSVSQWVKWDLHNGNCFISTITKKSNYANTAELNICENRDFWPLLLEKTEPLRWSDHFMEKERERNSFFRYKRFFYRDGVDLSRRNKKNQNQKSQIIFFTKLLHFFILLS